MISFYELDSFLMERNYVKKSRGAEVEYAKAMKVEGSGITISASLSLIPNEAIDCYETVRRSVSMDGPQGDFEDFSVICRLECSFWQLCDELSHSF